MQTITRIITTLTIALVATLGGCGKGEGDKHGKSEAPAEAFTDNPSDATEEQPSDAPTDTPSDDGAPAEPEPEYVELKTPVETTGMWEHAAFTVGLPEGWSATEGGGIMRAASIIPADASMPQIAVTKLGADFGGIEANLGRWRSQVGLGAPTEPGELASHLTPTKVDGRDAAFVDIEGPAGRMLVLVLPDPDAGASWFFKISGSPEHIAAQRDAFVAVAKSIKLK